MTNILDQIAVNRPLAGFRPTTVHDFFVLRLALKLGEPAAAGHYAELAGSHSEDTLRLAYRRAAGHGNPPRELAKLFHLELGAVREQYDHAQADRLLAIKVERRSVAVAVFVGDKLDYHDVRNLSSQPDKADASTIGFLTWVIGNFEIESAALEQMTSGDRIRRAILNQAILTMLRTNSIPVWEVSKRDLLEAYGHPPLRTRIELRKTTHSILWSMFNTEKPDGQELDAASLGLYVQTERLFLH